MSYPFALRKVFVAVDEILLEQGRASGPPVRRVAAAAVIGNPFAGAYGEDLAEMMGWGTALAELIGGRALAALGGERPQSFGKGCIVGVDGAPEHGIALITNAFGDAFRGLVGGKAWVPSNVKRGPLGATIDIPIAHKDALYVRDNYDTMEVTVPDAPFPDEIAVICVMATRGRMNARLGGLTAADAKGVDGLR
ncbi:MAG TPA: amino acid synthesis family protein [Burkholderiales bacterium]|nr:amino acid synthesis family protein [Burkholderiales bacterium]